MKSIPDVTGFDNTVEKRSKSCNRMNLCNRCRHGVFSMWGSYSEYGRYMCCPYSSHSHYPRKECVFYDKGNVPVCPQHKCEMISHGVHGEITIYRCPAEVTEFKGWEPCGTRPCSREFWVHKNGLIRQVERELDINSRTAKGIIKLGFDIIESTRITNWE